MLFVLLLFIFLSVNKMPIRSAGHYAMTEKVYFLTIISSKHFILSSLLKKTFVRYLLS